MKTAPFLLALALAASAEPRVEICARLRMERHGDLTTARVVVEGSTDLADGAKVRIAIGYPEVAESGTGEWRTVKVSDGDFQTEIEPTEDVAIPDDLRVTVLCEDEANPTFRKSCAVFLEGKSQEISAEEHRAIFKEALAVSRWAAELGETVAKHADPNKDASIDEKAWNDWLLHWAGSFDVLSGRVKELEAKRLEKGGAPSIAALRDALRRLILLAQVERERFYTEPGAPRPPIDRKALALDIATDLAEVWYGKWGLTPNTERLPEEIDATLNWLGEP